MTGDRPTLADIYERYREETDKGTGHTYVEFYEEILREYRDMPVNLVEIGIYYGASIRMWMDYFTAPNMVYGVDVNRSRLRHVGLLETPKVRLCFANVRSRAFRDFFDEKRMDVAIDDGSHLLVDQLAMVEFFAPRMRPGGILVVEDVQSMGDAMELHRALPGSSIDDRRALKGKRDDILVYKKFP